ncbi:hypothetical protein TBLA_0J00590 [Henningerozyma blattae CBS 6284]|uniref:SPX domain-containing protein n=1 Tax=Henningerozyma blattae (strain ATCC 34711 / CBS 6284 / DSM 70876 / NBRC 10599 / NRRL Y-10934 / UCD 77-7) TaxID=1071380 RepID=I2H9K7_HENB6|nr:hypothetical protein TBLA_0J00590 [Tetrapisispora blattae CBS 6284]CCH63059.1 hypothetical protein TBLA_0J00590 [Tetrapisispora blattae CBS 6284]
MRFSHFLKYNAVPEWQSHYLDYNSLKDLIYTLQTKELQLNDQGAEDTSNELDISLKEKLKKKLLFKKKRANSSGTDKTEQAPNSSTVETFSVNNFQDLENNYIEYSSNPNDNKEKTLIQEETIELSNFNTRPRTSTSSYSSSLNSILQDPKDVFIQSLNVQKYKIDEFYKRLENKLLDKYAALINDLLSQNIITPDFKKASTPLPPDLAESVTPEDSEEEEEEEDFTNDNTALLNYKDFNIESQKLSLLKQTITNCYIDLCQLKSFIELNKLAFSKITKKFDKVLKYNTRQELIQSNSLFKDSYTFTNDTIFQLNEKILRLIDFYSIINNYTILESKTELKKLLHDHIIWERSLEWKDMLGLESHDLNHPSLDNTPTANDILLEKLHLTYYKYPLPSFLQLHSKYLTWENAAIPKFFFTWKAAKIAFIFVFTAILLGVKTFNDRVEGRCMALVECCALLWATEAIPLFATAFLVPLLTVLFKVLKNSDGSTMSGAAASSTILSAMWSSTIMILLAGFTLSEALAQYDIARVFASWLLAGAGTKPRNVLLMAMGVVFFLSMWISNVAAPVLTYSLLSPLLDPLDASVPFARALVMGVAIAANIGGLSSPISSPQNVISMDYLKPYGIGWGQFFAVALPTGILSLILAWGLMCLSFNINKTKLEKFVPVKTRFSLKQWFIIGVSLATILLWCVESQIEGAFGSSGQIAILPIVLFFGTGILSTNDLNTFPWSIVVLAMGGIALGKAVSSSGLLSTIALALQKRIQNDGVMSILCIFGVLMLVVGTFVSHTVSAIIIIPLVQEVGDKLPDPKAAPILVFGCALLASAGMGLASAGFPNVTAISMVDKKGNRYLNMMMFLSRGVPASLIVFVCVITLGYGIMHSVLH